MSTVVPRSDRIPSLDGLRAVSILLVVMAHISVTDGFPHAFAGTWPTRFGLLGVEIFFCISGFIITHLLICEFALEGSISLRRFYARRAVRILPAFLTYVAFVALLDHIGVIDVSRRDFILALTFTANSELFTGNWYLGHTWSLSVEEQFYLIWPATLLLFLRKGWRDETIVRILTAVILASVPVCVIVKADLAPRWLSGFLLWIFPIYSGCLMAFVYNRRHAWLAALYGHRRATVFVVLLSVPTLTLVLLNSYGKWPWLTVPFRALFVSAWVAACIGLLVLRDGWIQRLLNTPAMIFLGVISYSLYLWQEIFLTSDSSAWSTMLGPWYLRAFFAFSAACLSYLLVERPLINLRARLR